MQPPFLLIKPRLGRRHSKFCTFGELCEANRRVPSRICQAVVVEQKSLPPQQIPCVNLVRSFQSSLIQKILFNGQVNGLSRLERSQSHQLASECSLIPQRAGASMLQKLTPIVRITPSYVFLTLRSFLTRSFKNSDSLLSSKCKYILFLASLCSILLEDAWRLGAIRATWSLP